MSIKVSVIVPSKDPGKCIERCISSLRKQSLKDIEIICIDGGSSDGSEQFLKEAEKSDPRIKVKERIGASFGELVNTGIEAALGRYIAVIRPGDWAQSDMLKELYNVSSGMDMVMSGFYLTKAPNEKEILIRLTPRYSAAKSFNPLLTFDTALDQSEIFSINCAAGSAIISRDVLLNHNIYFTETENSLYHDISFSFKVWACAENVRLLDTALLHCGYRGSTVHTSGAETVYPVFEEYEEIRYFIREVFAEDGERIRTLQGIMMRLKYDSYLSCCHILPKTHYKDFIRRASEEFQEDVSRGYVVQKYFPSFDWNTFSTWVYDPESFIEMIERSRKPSLMARIKKSLSRSK